MNNQVVVLGLGDGKCSIPEITDANSACEDGICVVQMKTSHQVHMLLKKLEDVEGVSAYSLSEFYGAIAAKDKEYVPLKRFDKNEFVDFQFSGGEQFIVRTDSEFSVYDQQSKEMTILNNFKMGGKCNASDDGVFVGIFQANAVEIRAGQRLEVLGVLHTDGDVKRIAFSRCSRYLAVHTVKGVELWDVMKNMCMLKKACELSNEYGVYGNAVFDEGLMYLSRSTVVFSLELGREIEASDRYAGVKSVQQERNQIVAFSEGRVQKIEYKMDEYRFTKTHANIDEIRFFFAKSRCFALMAKSIQKERIYFLESYGRDGITQTQLTGNIEQVAVSDGFFVVANSENVIFFYSRTKFGFKLMKEVRKEDCVILALQDNICCVYDTDSGNIEFYDNSNLRTTYTHHLCTEIVWSYSGLYVCSCSTGSCSSGLVQVFNRNGKLLWKKVFSGLILFAWRPFTWISEDEKAKALSEFSGEISSEIDSDGEDASKEELLLRWKNYLLSKRQMAAMSK
ncbi:hypothetical protein HK407_06g11140 [Ordospora pajunii]|jgi:hypothetical protein|uniref:uncharacterized protein n=1 Tax=Ordospora pajunii TaxID=3039483 RepID=UPI0029527747|nr:uncharacterized protein HK407_06g11140 [Ordospora pajunii]KAH9411284.1 hypothetical protein HK407_06g11140 [Ordospora pajunii]